MKTSTCCTCGHTWQTGTDGDHSCSQVLAAEVRRLRGEVDQLRCQLAGCGVAALENTVSSRSRRAVRGDYGHSASYEDVCNAVDREIALREENERLRKDAERLDWLSHQDFDALCLCLVIDAPHSGEYYVCGDNNDDGYGSTFREAIDAARSAKITQEHAP